MWQRTHLTACVAAVPQSYLSVCFAFRLFGAIASGSLYTISLLSLKKCPFCIIMHLLQISHQWYTYCYSCLILLKGTLVPFSGHLYFETIVLVLIASGLVIGPSAFQWTELGNSFCLSFGFCLFVCLLFKESRPWVHSDIYESNLGWKSFVILLFSYFDVSLCLPLMSFKHLFGHRLKRGLY